MHVASRHSSHRNRPWRSGKIGLRADAVSKIYLKPNKIMEASMSLLLGTEQAGGEPPGEVHGGASEQRPQKHHREL